MTDAGACEGEVRSSWESVSQVSVKPSAAAARAVFA
jgi:hypothetical protein